MFVMICVNPCSFVAQRYYAVFLYFCANNGISPRTTAGETKKEDSPLLEGK